MDAQIALIPDMFNYSTLMEIPFFQRGYVWDEDLWGRFLEDMEFIVKSRKPHFFGSLILKTGRERTEDDQFSVCRTVIDGQQRLTTLVIFMKVLCLKKNENSYFDMVFKLRGEGSALRLSMNDEAAFMQVMEAAEPVRIESDSKIVRAFNYFVENLDASKLDLLTIASKAQFVKINLSKEEDEQEIFDTINSLGVNLTTSELLKNYFFNKESLGEYQDKWVSIFEKNEDVKDYWNRELDAGRRTMIDLFFDAFFQIIVQDQTLNIKSEDSLLFLRRKRLANSYKQLIKNYYHGDKEIILKKLREYALKFQEIFRPEECDRSVSHEFSPARLDVVIFGLKNTTLIPYVLYVAMEAPEKLNGICEVLESYIMRRIIARESSKGYNKLFTSLIANGVLDETLLKQRLLNTEDGVTSTPNDSALLQGFKQSKLTNLQSKGVIYLIESKIRPVDSAVSLLSFNQYSLEHLLPKNWERNWSSAEFKDEDARKNREYRLLTLGNLAIIPQPLNASIRDGSWATKRKGKGKSKPGLARCAAGLFTLQDVVAKEQWNEDEILSRANWLFENSKNIWKY